jgi:hypothetical protein
MDFGGFHHGCQCGVLLVHPSPGPPTSQHSFRRTLVSKLLGSGIGPGQKWWPTALRMKDFFTFPKIFTCFTNVTGLLDPTAIKLKITGDQVLHSSEKVRDTDVHIDTYARKSWVDCNPKGFQHHPWHFSSDVNKVEYLSVLKIC